MAVGVVQNHFQCGTAAPQHCSTAALQHALQHRSTAALQHCD
jgi:hypothetical protein